jgi:hypothetical protein
MEVHDLLHGRTGRKKIGGGERNLPDFFGFCPRCQNNIFQRNFSNLYMLSTGGGAGKSDYEKFLLDSIFPTNLTEFPTKLTEFVPMAPILPDCQADIARLALFAQQTGGGGGCRPLRPSARYAHDLLPCEPG